jgi:riboflavin-specific deaminase-like protein
MAREVERPEVTVHFAQTLDGHIDRPAAGAREVISNAEGFELAHERRATHDAVLVGIRTVLRDDPKLRVTRVPGRSPHRVVLDSHLRTPGHARVLERLGAERVIVISGHDHGAPEALKDLQRRGAEVALVDCNEAGLVDIGSALSWLWSTGIRTLLVEGGAQTIESFLRANVVDHMSVEVAPRFLGRTGLPALGGTAAGFALDGVTVRSLGSHVLVSGVPVFE